MSWFAPAGAPASVEEVGAGGAVVAPPLPGAIVSVVVGSASTPPVELVTSREELELEDDELLDSALELDVLELALALGEEDEEGAGELVGVLVVVGGAEVEVLWGAVKVEGTGISAVSLGTGESKEPVMESSLNMVENWKYVAPSTAWTDVKLM